MMVTKAQAQAFLTGINKILDGSGFEERYYWDDGAHRDERGNLLGPSDKDRYLCDWIGYLVFRGNSGDGCHINGDSFPKSLLINGVRVGPYLGDGWGFAYYEVEALYQAWSANQLQGTFVIPRDKQTQAEQALVRLGVENLVFVPAQKTNAKEKR